MTKVRVYQHPFSAEPPLVFEPEGSFAKWFIDRYETRPHPQVFAGEPSAETDISGDAEAMLRGDAPEYVVLEVPGDPVSILVNFAISMVLSAAVNFLFAKDQPEQNLNRAQESPNNQLSGRENRVRLLQRVEDIFGTVRAIPSLMMPTYTKYIDHRKVEYGYYCVGRGYYDISEVRDGDTAVSEIDGASAAVYAPFTSPNSGSPQQLIGDAIIDSILTVTRSSAVDGITLKPANQLQITANLPYYFRGPGSGGALPTTTLDVIWQPAESRRPNFAAVSEIGQTLTVTMANTPQTRDIPFSGGGGGTISVDAATKTYTSTETGFFRGAVDGSTVTVAGAFAEASNVGAKTIVSHTGESITVAEAVADEAAIATASFALQINYSGTRTISAVESGYVTLTGAAQYFPTAELFAGVTITVDNGLTDWTGWVTLPDTDRTEAWMNVLAAAGMYLDDGAKSGTTVAYEIQIEQLDGSLVPTGVVETVGGSITGATSNERAETLERVTAWTGPARVRARRTTPFNYDFNGLVVDEIQWVDLYSVSPVDKLHFGNKTTIHTVTRANQDATTLRRRELNCLAARKLPTYNGTTFSGAFDSTGLHVSGTISATSKICDIIAAVSQDPQIGNRTLATDVDMAQIWGVQQALDAWNTECGQFNYTFDSDAISFEETLVAIAQAAFCVPYRQNGKIRLALDRPQATSTALFTHRNKRPDAETITRRFASDGEYDGVELVYQEPDSESLETIRLPLGGGYTKLKKVERTGIRSFTQAWFHANREYNRLRYQRLTIETETTGDGRALLPNARVDIVDNTRFKSWDGEVVGQSGLTLTLSRDVEFIPATPHSIVLMKRDGSLQSITCTAGPAANQVVLAGAPAEAIVTTPTAAVGIRTIFSFAADSARAAQAWLVQEIGSTDGRYVRIRAVNYSDEYYAADAEAVPAKESVIND
jgi:hypothetical protein